MKQSAVLAMLAVTAVLAGCITYTPQTRAIRVVYSTRYVTGCKVLGTVMDPSVVDAVAASFIGSGKGFTEVLNQAAALHANTVLITNVQRVAGTAYRCGG